MYLPNLPMLETRDRKKALTPVGYNWLTYINAELDAAETIDLPNKAKKIFSITFHFNKSELLFVSLSWGKMATKRHDKALNTRNPIKVFFLPNLSFKLHKK